MNCLEIIQLIYLQYVDKFLPFVRPYFLSFLYLISFHLISFYLFNSVPGFRPAIH